MTQHDLAQLYLIRRQRLAKQYTPLLYLESTGTQWIDTGYAPYTAHLDISVDMQLISTTGRYVNAFGVVEYISDSWRRIVFERWAAANYWRVRWSARSPYDLAATDWLSRHVLRINKRVISVDGVTKATASIWSEQLTNPIILFGAQTAIIPQTIVGDMVRIYGCTITNNVTPIRDFAPMLDPDGVPCMFDSVTQTPYYNAGTGDFLYG